MKTCPHCGTENPQENAACCNCYASLDAGGASARSSAPKAKPSAKPVERPRNVKVKSGGGGGGAAKALVFLLVVIILGGAGFGGYTFFLKPTPEKAVKQLVASVKKQDIDMCIDCLSSETQNLLNQVGIIGLIKQAQQKQGVKPDASKDSEDFNVKIDSVEYTDADHAVVTATADIKMPSAPGMPSMPMQMPGAGGNQQKTMRIPMIKEEGKWKVDGIKAIDDGLRSITDDQAKSFAGYLKLAGQMKQSLAAMSPELAGINLDPVTQIINKDLQRRNIDPATVKTPAFQMPFPMNMGR